MEGNKDEAIRCIEIALNKIADGNKDACIKFLNKSIALYPTSRARDLLDFYTNNNQSAADPTSPSSSSSAPTSPSPSTSTSTSEGSTSTSSTTHKRHNTQSTTAPTGTGTGSTTTPTESSKPKYTKEQVELVKKIKLCKNYYEVLEIKKTATENDIKKAYRKIALLMHPDKNHAPGAEEAFKKVSQAFTCLSDQQKRASYDLHGDETPHQQFGGGMHRGGGGGGAYYEEELTPEDIFNIFFGIPTRGAGRRTAGFGGQPMHHRAQQHNNPNMFHFQFGGGGGGAAARRGGRQQQGGESSMFTVLMLIVTVLYFMMSFFGGGGGSSSRNPQPNAPLQSTYRFTPKDNYNVERFIKLGNKDNHIDVEYYVTTGFETLLRYNGIRVEQVENEVKEVWLWKQKENCQKMDFLIGAMGGTAKDSYEGRKYQTEYLNAEKEGLFKYCIPLKNMGVTWSRQ
ncbi:hypothetical protein SAMD00019534_022970 [Acytostelium subglobosum LB1]|uniref:hypothetical protein n=1 Tax=Acytostelium subglobosum LB1 TaxID=1410327 RepID=UPI000644AA1E|nr:hypothetical protein SAMD00019534_022970 [Acytostelium subglobosum LB1]GAM19122.1 hypothetical protein SAMD00019534_022970 [Acytostelium subglobosum LB1]|eukprot:XP_012757049.1 hypothetical protein SAMD00019534_022970 [Acytostelium subglobosum LB1]